MSDFENDAEKYQAYVHRVDAQENTQTTQNAYPDPATYDLQNMNTYQYEHTTAGQAGYGQAGYGQNPGYGYAGQRKSSLAAGLLGIFLGCFGVHNFYLGYTGRGIAQLLLTLLSFGLLMWVSAIWGLIEGILYLAKSGDAFKVDAQGIPLE